MGKINGRFALIFAVLLAYPAAAQQRSVTRQLDDASRAAAARGFVQVDRELQGSLRNGQSVNNTIYLIKGIGYLLVGVCDNDCRDLDLALYDENNNKIEEDKSTDDTPMIDAVPERSGRFTLRVIMDDCRRDPCGWGVRIFSPR